MGLKDIKKTIDINKEKLILVEGQDDVDFFAEYIKFLNENETIQDTDIQVIEYKSKNNLGNFLKTLKISPNFHMVRVLGVVRDADTNAQSAWQSVHDNLRNAGLSAPENPMQVTASNPRVIGLILPDNNNPGAIESIVLASEADHPAMECVGSYFDCLNSKPIDDLPVRTYLLKAKVQTFLASRYTVPNNLGRAAQKRYWTFDHSALNIIRDFISCL